MPCLTRDDPNPDARAEALRAQRELYPWTYDRFAGVAMVKEVPSGDKPGAAWSAMIAARMAVIAANTAAVKLTYRWVMLIQRTIHAIKRGFSAATGGKVSGKAVKAHRKLKQLPKDAKVLVKEKGIAGVLEDITLRVHMPDLAGHFRSFKEFVRLFHAIDTPEIAQTWREDETFALMRLAGPNPLMLQKISAPDPRMLVDDALVAKQLGAAMTLAKAAEAGRLFLVDLTCFEGVQGGTFPHGKRKVVPAPLALFGTRVADGRLQPLGIRARASDPLWTPNDGMAWLAARTLYTVGDGTWHQAISHLSHTHLVVGPFVVAARRQLAPSHPLTLLLNPHVEGTLFINQLADTMLTAPGGGVDTVMSPPVAASRATAENAWKTYDWNAMILPKWLAARGLDDKQTLPNYPYRDDALLVWSAIVDWVKAYIDLYYADDAAVCDDPELQAFFAEVAAQDGGRMTSFGDGAPGRVQTKAYFVEAMAHVIFTASAQHSAVNFPQNELMGFVANYPLAAFKEGPKTARQANERALRNLLPPRDIAQQQMELGYLLGSARYGVLGQYDDNFEDERAAKGLVEFQAALAHIEAVIEDRNTKRLPYNFLRPSLITNSINI